jgi:hypothetical protein
MWLPEIRRQTTPVQAQLFILAQTYLERETEIGQTETWSKERRLLIWRVESWDLFERRQAYEWKFVKCDRRFYSPRNSVKTHSWLDTNRNIFVFLKRNWNMWFEEMFKILQQKKWRKEEPLYKFSKPTLQSIGLHRRISYTILLPWNSYMNFTLSLLNSETTDRVVWYACSPKIEKEVNKTKEIKVNHLS